MDGDDPDRIPFLYGVGRYRADGAGAGGGGDLDGDGFGDLLVDGGLFRGPLTSGFDPAAPDLAVGTADTWVDLGDLDGDGRDELAAERSGRWLVLAGPLVDGDLDLQARASFTPVDDTWRMTAGDLGADGVRDLLLYDRLIGATGTDLVAWLGLPAGTLDPDCADLRFPASPARGDPADVAVLPDGRLAVGDTRTENADGQGSLFALDPTRC